MSDARTRLLEKWLRGAAKTTGIPRRPAAEPVPLSFQQLRLWFLDRLVPGSPAYNIPVALRLAGPLDAGALERAINEVVRRHAVLRTTFPAPAGEPVQRIAAQATIPLGRVDLTGLPPAERDAEAERLIEQDARAPFDLANGPVMRAEVVRMGDDDHLLLLAWSHLVADGWSASVFSRELVTFYSGGTLPEPPVEYADYAVWQRDWLDPPRLAELLNYWREQLRDVPPVLDMPTDRPRPAIQSFRGDAISFSLPGQRVRQFAQRADATPFMVVLAAFQLVLSVYSRQTDIVIGTPVAGRTQPELENVIGFFANTLVLRTDLSGNPAFAELLARVRRTTHDAFAHQDVPFEKLVDELGPERSTSLNPLFQVMYVHNNTPAPQLRFTEDLAAASLLGRNSGAAKFDLWLSTTELGDELYCELEYATDLFDRATAERLAGHLASTMDSVLAGGPVSPLSEAERTQLERWNGPQVRYPGPELVHKAFEDWARRSPLAPAVVSEDGPVSYAELNTRANRLAHRLIDRGVGPGMLVGVHIERSVELVVALLAVLKAGGAYVPLDPGHPEERIRFMREDSRAALVLTAEDVKSSADGRPDDPVAGLRPEHPVYVIYTSGSTGLPKGAVNSHRAVVNRLRWMQADHEIQPGERVLQKTPVSFDVSVWELFLPLSVGATMVLARPDGHYDVDYLARLIDEQDVTTVHFVPSMLRLFLDATGRAHGLRRVVCSGEALPYALQERFFSVYPDVPLFNLYGPTEAAVDVTQWQCVPGDPRRIVPIGSPVANTSIRVVDSRMGLVPAGVPGELCIGGVQIADGYHGRPGLTAEKFVADPFGPPGTRLYRTGDLARWLPDGTLEYLGRLDTQVKLRGLRIEPGEIENCLRERADVADVAVTVSGTGDEQRLVAYVVAAESAASEVAEWAAVFDTAYAGGGPFAGWTSSFTGEPIPANEMRAWADATVERVLALRPQRVLEIGCGTGLLMLPIAPHCDSYVGMDVAQEGLDRIARELPGARLVRGAAHEVGALVREPVDTVVLNSVVQYFPNVDYLLDVLSQVDGLVADGGRVFLGDIRSLETLAVFHGLTGRSMWQEDELVIGQDLFRALRPRMPRLSRVEIQLKRGGYDNELSRFRYDVVLHLDGPGPEIQPVRLTWSAGLDVSQALAARPDALIVGSVPNARLRAEGIDPDVWWDLGTRLGYETEVRWCGATACDVVFRKPDVRMDDWVRADCAGHTNRPDLPALAQRFGPLWRAHLAERLPAYMVPSMFLPVAELPLNANGKCDRSALPEPPPAPPETTGEMVEPRDDTERIIAKVWTEVLGLQRVSVTDDYFELGGDSIRAIRVIAALNREGLALSPRDIFGNPTVEALAAVARPASDTSDTVHRAFELSERDAVRRQELLRTHEDVYPLSPYQEYMLGRALRERKPDLYLVQRVQWMPGLDVARFRRAWQRLGEDFPILRTSFVWSDLDRPLQVVHHGHAIEIDVRDWTGLTGQHRDRELNEYLRADAARGLPPGEPGGVRVLLATVDDSILSVLTFSYLRVDGWTLGLISESLQAAYDGQTVHGGPPYRGFIEWVSGRDPELDHWRETLAGAPLEARLAAPPEPGRSGLARQHVYLPRRLTTQLLSTAQSLRCTPNVLVQLAWAMLLAQRTGNCDVTFGVFVTGRTTEVPDIDAVRGPTMNVLPMRLRTDGKPVPELVAELAALAMDLESHEQSSPGLLGDELFESYLIFQNLDSASFHSADPIPVFFSRMGYPVRVDVFPGVRTGIAVSYHRDHISDSAVAEIAGTFEAILDAVTTAGYPPPAAPVVNPTRTLVVEGEVKLSQVDLVQPA